jgi:hypothetical protein
VKRTAVIKTIKQAARAQGLDFQQVELSNHTGIIVGDFRSTIGRHREIDDITVGKFYKQFEGVLGEGWWKK